MAGLELKSVNKSFGDVGVIHDVNLTIEDGEFVVFVGPSGCGKSTLLRLVAGLEEATSGTIGIDGQDMTHVEPASRGVAMVFQSYALYPHMTVEENMGFGLRMNGAPKAEIRRRVDKAAAILHLEELLKRKPKQLSGGQRQRVAIGRAIVREPHVFLFDEPLSNLDAELRVRMRLEIARLHKELGATMIYVTHDQVEAMTLADKIVVLNAGRVEQVGAPLDLYDDPDNLFVAGFLGSPRINLIKARRAAQADGRLTVELPEFGDIRIELELSSPPPDAAALVLGVRPEHFEADGAVRITTIVDLVEDLGGVSFAYARSGEERPLVIERKNARDISEGERLTVGFDPARALLFDARTGLRIR